MNLRPRPITNESPRRPARRPLLHFLWSCSGANQEVLAACPRSEHVKFAGIGATVFFTGLLAALSGGYAFYTVFNSTPLAVVFGLLWGGIIFNLDRFVVATIKKDGAFSRQLLLAIPRLLLAIALAVVIAKPLELRIFQGEIEEILAQQKMEKGAAAGAEFRMRSEELDARRSALQATTEARREQRERDYQDYKCECDGTCGTGQRGRGSECARKEEKYRQSNVEYQQTKAVNDAEIAAIGQQINELDAAASTARQTAEAQAATGLLARLSASKSLPQGPGNFIVLLFLLIEVAPILTKLLSPRGPYDELLARIEHQFYLEQIRLIEAEKLAVNKEVSLRSGLHRAEVDAEVQQKQQTLRAVADARMEIVQDQIDAWLAEERIRQLTRRPPASARKDLHDEK
ncbi:DUF4407 domain-containing protein [Neolewinella lacunae]|uniref:DUF4407 domain-containing protein n=1 Tax=Neolewinella lacunae TaxID=1517758 RepID=A0A923PQG2_9BACT|nr:DUF4407 domain-containing protein [Neolewinella lacunae]MBC6996665.1 DUF4407 domain-containing protein [Neolewinella lacunae]MDN3634770.1 DUF4407 domain-containing protein [Neolewinella lacunae]